SPGVPARRHRGQAAPALPGTCARRHHRVGVEAPGPWAGGDGLGCRSHRSGPGPRAAAWRSATGRGSPGAAGAGPEERGPRTRDRGELTVVGRTGQRPGEIVVTS